MPSLLAQYCNYGIPILKKTAQFCFKSVTLNADWVYLCEPWELASLLFLSTILLRLQLISAGPCKQRTELNQAHPLYK